VELSDRAGGGRDGEIVAAVGGTFEVSLEGTPTAGFVWEAELPDDGRQLVEPEGSEWRQPPARRLGGADVQVFRFRALRRGRATLRFRYRRPWESHSLRERLAPSTSKKRCRIPSIGVDGPSLNEQNHLQEACAEAA